MPKTIASFINDLAIKAGMKADDQLLKDLLSDADLARITMPDEMANAIDHNVVSLTQAKNNHPDIKKHYVGPVYNGIDERLNKIMEELQIGDDVKAVILNERSTPERIAMLTRKVKELESAKKQTDDKGEKAAFQKEINELRAQLKIEGDKVENVRREYEDKIANIHKTSKLSELLAGYKTVYDDLPIDARNTSLMSLIDKMLQEKNAEFKLGENGQLQLLRKDGSNVFGDDHQQWSPQVLIDKTLSQYKLLKVNDQKPSNSGNTQTTVVNNDTGDQRNTPKKDTALSNLVNSALSDIEKAAKTPVM